MKAVVSGVVLIAVALSSASAANARFLQTDPVGYKDQVNLYEYVNDDPINNRDPSGLYICQGSSENCGAFAASLQRGRDALTNGNLSKADRSAISGVLKTYGKEGVRNGVGVTFRTTAQIRAVTTGAAYTQSFPKKMVFRSSYCPIATPRCTITSWLRRRA